MPRKKVATCDFHSMFDTWVSAVEHDPALSTDPILKKNIEEFGRLIQIADDSFAKSIPTVIEDGMGKLVANPAVAIYQKTQAQLLKTSEFISKRTETLVIGGGVKTW